MEAEEQPLTVREWEAVRRLEREKETSLAVLVPKSCIPRPANPSFSTVDVDRSSFP